jgi:hypothetical protein
MRRASSTIITHAMIIAVDQAEYVCDRQPVAAAAACANASCGLARKRSEEKAA